MRNVCGQEELLQIFGTELVAPTKKKMKIELNKMVEIYDNFILTEIILQRF